MEDEKVHLFLFIHGLWGNPNHMSTIEKAVVESVSQVSDERIVTIKPSSFRFWKTYDGIERCAESTMADLFYEIETLKLNNKAQVSKISIIGYSLGGLISRYMIGQLYQMGFFEEVTPIFFCTFATPHVGVHFFKEAIFDKVANRMGKRLFGRTGFQLFLKDSERLLLEMSGKESMYMNGLRVFQHRILLANIKNDRTVPFYTSFITEYSPFDSLNSIDIQYLGCKISAKVNNVSVWPKFVDLRRSSRTTDTKIKHKNTQEATSILRSNIVVRYTLLLCAALILFPFYLPLILCLSLYVSGYSILKIKVVKGPNISEHWSDVRSSVFHGGTVDAEHAKQGHTRRTERKNLSRQESFKGDTSKLTENAMENMLAAEEKFTYQPNQTFESIAEDAGIKSDDSEIHSEKAVYRSSAKAGNCSFSEGGSDENTSTTMKEPNGSGGLFKSTTMRNPLDIPVMAYDEAIRKHMESLKWNSEDPVPLFEKQVQLPLSKSEQQIVRNLNELSWIKIPIYHDSFNAHDSIVARRGGIKNPKGTCTLFFWASILRIHINEKKKSIDVSYG